MSAGPGQRQTARRVGPVRSRQTFDRLRRSPQRARAGPVSVSYLDHHPSSRVEIAYALGRPVGTAVVRNRLRRRMRAIVADAAPALPAGAYLVGAGSQAAELDFEELKVTMWRALERATAGPLGGRSGEPPGQPREPA